METKDLGRLFFHPIKLNRAAPHMFANPTYETEDPFRASRSVVLHLFGLGIVIGWWEDNPFIEDEVASLLRAMQAEVVWITKDETMHHARQTTNPWVVGDKIRDEEGLGW